MLFFPLALSTIADLAWPFGELEGLEYDEVCETAYEIFFTSCRSSPGFGSRNASTFYSSRDGDEGTWYGALALASGPGSFGRRANQGVVDAPLSTVKRDLGLKTVKRPQHGRRMTMSAFDFSGDDDSESSTSPASARPQRSLKAVEIMKRQMRVSEQSDNRLRKTLMRTLVGQMGRKPETIIIPLELIRHIKPSEFNDPHEYHIWQKRQLKILEAALLIYPSIPLDESNSSAMHLRESIRAGDCKPIDTSKNSETWKTLCTAVASLAWRNTDGFPTDVCHWADGFPLNIHLYICLLQGIFDTYDKTVVLDEVDELLELMTKTWTTLGIDWPIHNACFTWVLFRQYVATNQTEPDLVSAACTMLTEVENDAQEPDREEMYVKILFSIVASIRDWTEKRLLRYHEYFDKASVSGIDSLLPLALSSAKILGEDATIMERDIMLEDSTSDHVGHYIRSSMKNAFTKMIENENANKEEGEEPSVTMLKFTKRTEELAEKERAIFSPVLKSWHPIAAGVAVVMLHQCYGDLLKEYVTETRILNGEVVGVLQGAAKLEQVLVQMVVEDSEDSENGGKGIVTEMDRYEVDSITLRLLRQWIDERLKQGKDLLGRAKETETWNPKSKFEPYATSSVELTSLANETAKDFFEIPVEITDDLILELAEGLEQLFHEYTTFVASCGLKKNYLPTLPPLSRCNRDSTLFKIFKKATPCAVGVEEMNRIASLDGRHSRPTTSRGTQRLYIRLNTLHYLISNLDSLGKALTSSLKGSTRNDSDSICEQRDASCAFFKNVIGSIQDACAHVSEVAAYRLIFLDSNSSFYEGLYVEEVTNTRIRPAIKVLKQNLTLLHAMVTNRAQPLATKEVMKASFEAFLMVLLAGGPSRAFNLTDHEMIDEDFHSLQKAFYHSGEELISDEEVQREAETVEGVISLMSQSTEQLMEDLNTVTSETSGIGVAGSGQKLPMPPTTGRWDKSDPNTILRVLCHRNDRVADQYVRKSFQLAKKA
ncbi:peptide transporter PTR3-A-like [Hibiscus syriacus]|uniref:Peptide transporter PTR3-A-like n=1 Tax=Hibiscus syriacus TaxID=106335 RepID=A0A6A3BGS6_HIBSY|nr:protein unc-13 homolog [Hibiscus syriacus]KAE8714648.1 peptide transporter PTR3-A-like [Hibiscus syriacus]